MSRRGDSRGRQRTPTSLLEREWGKGERRAGIWFRWKEKLLRKDYATENSEKLFDWCLSKYFIQLLDTLLTLEEKTEVFLSLVSAIQNRFPLLSWIAASQLPCDIVVLLGGCGNPPGLFNCDFLSLNIRTFARFWQGKDISNSMNSYLHIFAISYKHWRMVPKKWRFY